MIDLDKNLQPGKSFHLVLGSLTAYPHNQLLHIRAIIDDQIVYRYWYHTRQVWIYQIVDRTFFEVYNRNGILRK